MTMDITYLQTGISRLSATTVGSYALFGGGENSSTDYNTVDAYETLIKKNRGR